MCCFPFRVVVCVLFVMYFLLFSFLGCCMYCYFPCMWLLFFFVAAFSFVCLFLIGGWFCSVFVLGFCLCCRSSLFAVFFLVLLSVFECVVCYCPCCCGSWALLLTRGCFHVIGCCLFRYASRLLPLLVFFLFVFVAYACFF